MTLKIKEITCSHTRQVQAYTPATFSITAQIGENDDPEVAAKDLQRLVLKVLYRDDVKQRDHLINTLAPEDKPLAPKNQINNVPFDIKKENKVDLSEPSFE